MVLVAAALARLSRTAGCPCRLGPRNDRLASHSWSHACAFGAHRIPQQRNVSLSGRPPQGYRNRTPRRVKLLRPGRPGAEQYPDQMVDFARPRIHLSELCLPAERCCSEHPNFTENDAQSLSEVSASRNLWTLLAAVRRAAFSACGQRCLRRFQRRRRGTFGRLPLGWRIAT